MRSFAKPLALLALALTVVPPAVIALEGVSAGPAATVAEDAAVADAPPAAVDPGMLTEGQMRQLMVFGTVLWFATAPFWLREDD